ncbi:MAG: FAD-binding protein [Chloroflexota bacterium]|nr:FAD-binding protein [Chloroflexota bacterium]
MTEITRREFIKGAAVTTAAVAGASALAGCAPAPDTAPGIPEKWDKEVDVVVVGYGLAGAATALAAEEAGAEVVILEKMPQGLEGGNSKVSGNLVFIPGNVEDGKAYFKGMAGGHMLDMPEEMVQTWVDEMIANQAWLEDLGLEPMAVPPQLGMSPELPHLPGAETMMIYSMGGAIGNAVLWDPVAEEVAARGIEILYETPGKKLVANCAGEVLGVIAESGGAEIAIKAKKGVVLTCGGFEFNEAMKANYLHAPCIGMGTPANTGDGILMAQALGADLWHMNNHMGPLMSGFVTDDLGPELSGIPTIIMPAGLTYIFVDKYGKRFMNEIRPHDHGHGWDEINYYDGNHGEYPRIPWWIVFDEAIRTASAISPASLTGGPTKTLFTWFGWYAEYEWSADNSAEIEKGWILKGDTIEELASAMGVDPATLAATLSEYNEYAAAGEDKRFGRPAMAPLAGPFYAIQAWPIMVNTQGGPRRNHEAQVLHVEGHPISRLYSAGECGSAYAWQYQGGGNLGECLAFGRIAGKNVAAEEDWS